jgi:hypothetical protein
MLPLAISGHLIFIPRFGPVGAASITTLFALIGAFGLVVAVHIFWRVLPPLVTVVRAIMITGLAFAVAVLWPTPGFLLLLKLLVIGFLIALSYFISGEFSAEEIALVRSLFLRRTGAGPIRSSNNEKM